MRGREYRTERASSADDHEDATRFFPPLHSTSARWYFIPGLRLVRASSTLIDAITDRLK